MRPVVKVIGEFWAQMTESDGNFRMLEFLEKEGAEVSIEPISTWLLYLLHQRKMRRLPPAEWQPIPLHGLPQEKLSPLARPLGQADGFMLRSQDLSPSLQPVSKTAFDSPTRCWRRRRRSSHGCAILQYVATRRRGAPGGRQNPLLRRHKGVILCWRLSLSAVFHPSQSDAVQASLVEKFPEVSFLPIETSADGEIHAYSRVQMALSEAGQRHRWSLSRHSRQRIIHLKRYGRLLPTFGNCVRPLHSIPRRPGVVSTAANFLLYADQLMSSRFSKDAIAHSQRERHLHSAAISPADFTGD